MLLAASWRRPLSSLMACFDPVQVRPAQVALRQEYSKRVFYTTNAEAIRWRNYPGEQPTKLEHEAQTTEAEQGEKQTGAAIVRPNATTAAQTYYAAASSESQSSPKSCPTLSAEQEAVVSQALEGRNIFFTGSAGCGKSTVTKAIRDRLREEGKVVHTLAPTGMVAVANGGMTTWSFAAWTPNTHKLCLDDLRKTASASTAAETRTGAKGHFLSERLKSADVIILDEISMMEAMHFERLNQLMKAAWPSDHKRSRLPFGGTQIIVTGDFCQLPPVKPFRHCYNCGSDLKRNRDDDTYTCPRHGCGALYRDEDKWAFKSRA